MASFARWLALIPAAVISIIIGAFVLHFVLFITLTMSGMVEPFPAGLERIVLPFTSATIFVVVGTFIAPSNRHRVAIVLGSLWIIATVCVIAFVIRDLSRSQYELNLLAGGLASLMGIAGAFVGMFVVRKIFDREGKFVAQTTNDISYGV